MENIRITHEFLKEEDYYENRPVGNRGKSDKYCEHCQKIILKGTPHDVHYFYPEFNAYPTHKKCSDKFKESLLTEEESLRKEEIND